MDAVDSEAIWFEQRILKAFITTSTMMGFDGGDSLFGMSGTPSLQPSIQNC